MVAEDATVKDNVPCADAVTACKSEGIQHDAGCGAAVAALVGESPRQRSYGSRWQLSVVAKEK